MKEGKLENGLNKNIFIVKLTIPDLSQIQPHPFLITRHVSSFDQTCTVTF